MRAPLWARALIFLAGLVYLFVALSILAAPRWFYETFGRFPPYNRHYMGDTAAFILPLAVGLLVSAKDPDRHRLVIGIGAAASLVHLLNHLFDLVVEGHTHGHWLVDFVPLALFVVALGIPLLSRSGQGSVGLGSSTGRASDSAA